MIAVVKFLIKGFVAAFIGCVLLAVTTNKSENLPIGIAAGFFIVFALPYLLRKGKENAQQKAYERAEEERREQRRYAEEEAHQTGLRRERERLEMQQDMRVRELIAVLEVQSRADAAKLAQLAKMKAELAERQNSDLAGLLARLEAMKG